MYVCMYVCPSRLGMLIIMYAALSCSQRRAQLPPLFTFAMCNGSADSRSDIEAKMVGTMDDSSIDMDAVEVTIILAGLHRGQTGHPTLHLTFDREASIISLGTRNSSLTLCHNHRFLYCTDLTGQYNTRVTYAQKGLAHVHLRR